MIEKKNQKTAQELIKELYDGKMAFGGGRIEGTSSCHFFISFWVLILQHKALVHLKMYMMNIGR